VTASLLPSEIAVDLFAGGGGASTGFYIATGRHPDIAVNHNPAAVEMHTANHPTTQHFCESVWEVDPRTVVGRRKVGFLWASPDCRHFSRAKGGAPVSKGVRSLAHVVIEWARAVKPRIIMLENVEEFATWGPLLDDGRPCPARKGEDFRAWVAQLEWLGYEVQWRSLVAADYGAPTTRKRLFLVARRDGLPIVWPEPTHGPGRTRPWRTAAEIIDWSVPCPSIFERKKPLAEATQRRIARGLRRFVLEAAKPFIVTLRQHNRERGLDEPITTITTGGGSAGGHHAVVVPAFVTHLTHHGERRAHGTDEPLPTVTAANRGEMALIAPTVVGIDNRSSGDSPAWRADAPLTTIVTENRHALVAPVLIQTGYGERDGQAPRCLDIETPLGTVVAGGAKHALVAAWLTKHYGGVTGHEFDRPIGSVTTVDHHSLTTATLHPGIADHRDDVRAFLVKYYGTSDAAGVTDPLDTVTTRDRFGLVTVEGVDYEIADVGMRMLTPRELFAAQGFPANYNILDGQLTKTQQIALAGNSVCPDVAAALVASNLSVSAPARRPPPRPIFELYAEGAS
jgi:DNA (cytosine-5)-methyltransferase 1